MEEAPQAVDNGPVHSLTRTDVGDLDGRLETVFTVEPTKQFPKAGRHDLRGPDQDEGGHHRAGQGGDHDTKGSSDEGTGQARADREGGGGGERTPDNLSAPAGDAEVTGAPESLEQTESICREVERKVQVIEEQMRESGVTTRDQRLSTSTVYLLWTCWR